MTLVLRSPKNWKKSAVENPKNWKVDIRVHKYVSHAELMGNTKGQKVSEVEGLISQSVTHPSNT